MRDLSGLAEQLRNVREAERKFLQMWAVEQAVIVPGLDRVAADINSDAIGPVCWDSSSLGDDGAMHLGD